MSVKGDRAAPRTAADIERKYNFGKTFAEMFGLAKDARTASEEALVATKQLNESLTSEEIFNRLTKNGEVEGIYRDSDGQVYVNADYIKGGELLADLIKSGVLASKDGEKFYLDLDNGILKASFDELTISGKSVEETMEDKLDTYDGIHIDKGKFYINASYIYTGNLDASLIKTGVIQSPKGLSINLDTGQITSAGNNGSLSLFGGDIILKTIDGFNVFLGGNSHNSVVLDFNQEATVGNINHNLAIGCTDLDTGVYEIRNVYWKTINGYKMLVAYPDPEVLNTDEGEAD